MRELKFRAWNPTTEQMTLNIHDKYEEPFSVWWDGAEKQIVMQFTGLLDKKGKEIYEGDILCHKNYNGNPYYWSIDAKMIQSCGCCATVLGWELCGDEERAEVVGNIYENSELLEKNK